MLHANAAGNPSYGEAATISATADLDYYPIEYLGAFSPPFHDFGAYLYGISRGKVGNFGICFLGQYFFNFHIKIASIL
jgi:hypothetical protein